MSKAYPSNLTRAQYEFLSDMIPEPKPGGRKREVNMWEVLNAILYVRSSWSTMAISLRHSFAYRYQVTSPHGRQCTHIFATGGKTVRG
jgi:hypothetical protein